jgi:hypothetical protein
MKFIGRGFLPALVLPLFAAGCSGLFGFGEDEAIKLTTVPPDPERCEFVAQAVGSGSGGMFGAQGTRDEAEDNIEDIARRRGGNVVHILETQSRELAEDGSSHETIMTGHVYRCR